MNTLLASDSRVEKNLKPLLMKNTESFGVGARGKILNSINENFDGSQSIVVRDWVAWT